MSTSGHIYNLLGSSLGVIAIYVIVKLVNTFFVDGLGKVPGPKINAISRIPWMRHMIACTTVDSTVDLHKKYGDVVRISPNEVSLTSIDTAFHDVYGFRTGKMRGHLNMQKDPIWYPKPINGEPSILVADDEGHTRGRRLLSHAFSEKALMEQEPLVQRYVDQLVNGLKETVSKSKEAVDMVKWYNWTTFDVIADLMFGEPFGCLHDFATHKYVSLVFQSFTSLRFHYILSYFPILKYFNTGMVDPEFNKKRKEYQDWVTAQTKKRCEMEVANPDFMTHILKHNGEKGAVLSEKEIASNASLLLTAGSETTATLLSGATYLLLKNPDKFQKLKDEIRGKWKNYDDITLESVNDTPYLIAVMAESLRYFPPVPTGFERRVGKGGEMVSGYFMPEGTGLAVSHFAAYHSEHNFKDPDAFVPERWMGDERYADDKRNFCQPFSFGPRNCLGKNLAYAEMRLIVAKLLWTFDLELDAQSRNWMNECKCNTLWVKPELGVRLTEVVR